MFAADARKHTPGKNAEKENLSMRILVCDDDAAFAGQLAEKIEAIVKPQMPRSAVNCATDAAQLRALPLAKYDLAFLDIDMGPLNGVDLARRLHELRPDMLLIFVTNYVEYSLQGYEVQAFRYLLKAEMPQKLERYVQQALTAYRKTRDTVRIFCDGEDVLTGVSKKNTGQLPQYYIENNHEGIVTKQTFREAQAEIARRNSKSATNHRKRHRGRYNSKYALSERLVCGDCGSSYKRVTWSIHGRKQIVWRCVNRLEYGTKFCSNSPSIPETELHQAILKAVQNLAAKFTGEVADQLNGILHQIEVGESLTPQLQAQLEQNQQEFDHLLEMSLDFDENTPFLDDKLKRLSDKIKQLKTAITQSSVNSQTPSTPTNPITAKDLLITEYDDMLTARIIEKIIVKSRQDLEIIFIGGYTQQISLQ